MSVSAARHGQQCLVWPWLRVTTTARRMVF